MSLFQQSVQKKFINELDKHALESAYQKLLAHFGNPTIQENIRNAKEEEYQEGFVRDLFVNVLGYVLKPQPQYNFVLEKKNEKDSKKADGAILKNDAPIAVLELKSLKTTDLQSVQYQAFNYKNNQKDCVYVITSNFQKLRFYIDNSVDFEEFDLFDLSKERFALLYLCLQADNVLADLPLRIKKASLEKEENITQKLYNDYSLFKKALFNDISNHHRDADRLLLFKKTQKLLDRFLFIFFAEDKGLLPPNSITEILDQWDKLKELDEYQPLYNRFKKYFGYLNTGYKGKHYDIFAYNGGLFAPDAFLDNLTITDNILYNHARVLAHYDFDTEIDTNILGHIFEHSLNELDEVAAHTEGVSLDKTKTKRKKDGIFYTPRYITKYIVESTVGELCKRKKEELGLDSVALEKANAKTARKKYQEKINDYRAWLLQLTILDPACGSGAFLNQALEFLVAEHRLVDDMTAMLFGDSLVFTDNVTDILENNIFGVDINEESVEIARLSLWLRTAKVGRKLNDLSRNIKCGNSLISDPSVAGDLAFDWQTAFPQVFEKGGFDVVIGNPPYVRHELITAFKPYLQKNYNCFNGMADLYTYFFEKGIVLLKENGLLGYIAPNKFINSNYGINLRKFLSTYEIKIIVDFGELSVFSDAATFPAIYIVQNKKNETKTIYKKIENLRFNDLNNEVINNYIQTDITDEKWKLFEDTDNFILKKITTNSTTLIKYVNGEIKFGIKTGFNEAYIIDENKRNELIKEDSKNADIIYPFIDGDNIRKYKNEFKGKYIIAAKMGLDLEDYPSIMRHFTKYKNQLEKRSDKGDKWYQLRACSYYHFFEEPKILYPDIALESRFSFDETGIYPNATLFVIPKNDKYLLSILNSKLAWFYFSRNCPVIGDISNRGRLRLKTAYVSNLPIKEIDLNSRQLFIEKADALLQLNANFQKQSTRFIKLLQSSFPHLTVNKKLESWYDMSFGEFRKELDKQKVVIPIKELMDYQDLFETHATQIKDLQHTIQATDKAIDKLVYELYELTPEEIQIIENQ